MHLIGRVKSLATGSAAIMASRLAGAGLGFLTQFLLVRLMGAHELGLFYGASSLAAVLGVIASQGYPQIAARFVCRYRNKNDSALAGRFVTHAMRDGLVAALLAALGIALWSILWPGMSGEERIAYTVSGLMLFAIVSLNIMTNIAGGMRHFVLCYMPEGLIRPALFFVTIAALGAVGVNLSGPLAIGLFAVITGLITVIVAVPLILALPSLRLRHERHNRLGGRWRQEAWQLVLMAVFTNFFADVGILVVLPFLTNTETAVFGLCLKLALLVGYFVQIGQQMTVPDLSDARHQRDTERLRAAAWRSITLPGVICLLSLAVVYLFGESLLRLFGPDFAGASGVLLILIGAQLLRTAAGPGGHLLTLTGTQSINMAIAVSSLLLLFLASALLSPHYGVEGATYAVLIVYAYWLTATALALRYLKEAGVDLFSLLLARQRSGSPVSLAGVAARLSEPVRVRDRIS